MTNTFNIQVYLGEGFLSSVTTSYGQRCSMVQCFGCSDGVILSKESWSWCHCLSNRVFTSNICRVCRGHAISSTTPGRLVRCHGGNFSSTRKLHVDLCKWKHDLSNHLESWQVKRNLGLEKGHAFSRQSDMKWIDVNRVLGATGLCHIVAGHLKSRSWRIECWHDLAHPSVEVEAIFSSWYSATLNHWTLTKGTWVTSKRLPCNWYPLVN